jgi:NAD(P)-dependent dehydrogenase (short-subunit alcohol dehydrogenase family)
MTAVDPRSLFDLAGKVALVTGASSGIGRALAGTLAQAGASVVLAARREDELATAAADIAAAGGHAATVVVDLVDRKALRAAAVLAGQAFGAPDIVVNAAGINVRKPLLQVADDDWDRTMALNLTAPFFLVQALAPAMIAKGWGRVVNIASLQSVRAFADSAPYGASKGGIMQLTRAQAEALSRHGVTANAIAPGFFRTPLTAPVFADPVRAQAMAARTMAGRNGEMQDLAGTLLFLASDASAYVTGQTLFVDGGFSAG